jgi:hypothetical protein
MPDRGETGSTGIMLKIVRNDRDATPSQNEGPPRSVRRGTDTGAAGAVQYGWVLLSRKFSGVAIEALPVPPVRHGSEAGVLASGSVLPQRLAPDPARHPDGV